MKKKTLKSELTEVLETESAPTGALKLKKAAPYVPTFEDPREELKHLVKQHKALTRHSVAITSMCSDREFEQEDGSIEVVKTNVPEDAQLAMKDAATVLKKKAGSLESLMLKNLKKIPVYEHFLSKVFGVGPVVAAYLVSEVDIHKATKISNLRRYCGLAVINGVLERPTKGVKLGYNKEIRTRLYQMFSSIWKNAAKTPGGTSKYLTVWTNYRFRMANSERIINPKVENGLLQAGQIKKGNSEKEVSAKGFVHSTGWHKAADVFIEDLYVVWRTLEGLEVWPSYYAAKLGYEHGGKISVNAPKRLTLEQALETVGDVGMVGAQQAAE